MRETKTADAVKAQATAELWHRIKTQLTTLTDLGQREMVEIVSGVIGQRGRKEIRAVMDRLVPSLGDAIASYDTIWRVMPQLSNQDLLTLQWLALLSLFYGKLTDEYSRRPLVGWYLDNTLPAPTADAPESAQEEAAAAGNPLVDVLMLGDEGSILAARLAKKQARWAASHDETERAVLSEEIADLQIRLEAMGAPDIKEAVS